MGKTQKLKVKETVYLLWKPKLKGEPLGKAGASAVRDASGALFDPSINHSEGMWAGPGRAALDQKQREGSLTRR